MKRERRENVGEMRKKKPKKHKIKMIENKSNRGGVRAMKRRRNE